MLKTIALLTAVPLAAAAIVVPAQAAQADRGDRQKNGACGAGTYELQVEREDGGFDVAVDLDRLAPGSTWKVVLRHDGKRVAKVTRTADEDGDVELDAWRRNTAGSDTFTFRATPVGGGQGCSASIRVG